MSLPIVKLGSSDITRLIVGGNPFSGFSHQTPAKSKEMVDYYTMERVLAVLDDCQEAGINAFLGRADNFITRVLNEHWNGGGSLQWIAQTASERADVPANIRMIAALRPMQCVRAIAIYHHGSRTDQLFRQGRMDEVLEYVKLMQDLGFPAGVGTHNPQVIEWIEEAQWELDFYLFSFYDLPSRGGEVYVPEDRERACRTIQAVDKPVLAIKVLAAGRNDPQEAIPYALSHIKPQDAIVVGFYPEHQPRQVFETAALVEQALQCGLSAAS